MKYFKKAFTKDSDYNFQIGFAVIKDWKANKSNLQKILKQDIVTLNDLQELLIKKNTQSQQLNQFNNNRNNNNYYYNNYNNNNFYNQHHYSQNVGNPNYYQEQNFQNYQQPNSQLNNLEKLMQKCSPEIFNFFIKDVCKLALNVEDLFQKKQKIPNLRQNSQNQVQLTRKQCATIVSLLFLNLLESDNRKINKNINMSILFEVSHSNRNDSNFSKLECFYQYLQQIISQQQNSQFMEEKVTLKRCQADKLPKQMNIPLSKLYMDHDNPIQFYKEQTQADFANKYLGGGVLGNGSVQEEILFATCPELLSVLIFSESLLENESIVFQNIYTYTTYTGYSNSFKYLNNVENYQPLEIVAIDSIDYSRQHPKTQFNSYNIEKEILKAFAGFQNCDHPSIATGNWGCGAFKSDPQLKLLIQWIAASLSGKNLTYCSFQNKQLTDFYNFQQMLSDDCQVSDIYQAITNLNDCRFSVFEQVANFAYNKQVDKQQKNFMEEQKQRYQELENNKKLENSKGDFSDFQENELSQKQNYQQQLEINQEVENKQEQKTNKIEEEENEDQYKNCDLLSFDDDQDTQNNQLQQEQQDNQTYNGQPQGKQNLILQQQLLSQNQDQNSQNQQQQQNQEQQNDNNKQNQQNLLIIQQTPIQNLQSQIYSSNQQNTDQGNTNDILSLGNDENLNLQQQTEFVQQQNIQNIQNQENKNNDQQDDKCTILENPEEKNSRNKIDMEQDYDSLIMDEEKKNKINHSYQCKENSLYKFKKQCQQSNQITQSQSNVDRDDCGFD